jgi:hypothetical protein
MMNLRHDLRHDEFASLSASESGVLIGMNKSTHLFCGLAKLENRKKCIMNSFSLYENIGLFYKVI